MALQYIELTPGDIEKACSELKTSSSPGPDGVPSCLLKQCRKELSLPLFYIWRASLDTGIIPEELLLVLISPIHKGGSRTVPKNFRPVALTSHIIKVFERVLRVALVEHINLAGILPQGQHGSRARRSTLAQLLSYWDSILDDLQHDAGVDSIYLDFSKTFDKVETGVLLHKLKTGKIVGKIGKWLAAFLDSSKRKQAVQVEGRTSGLSAVTSGVPQGTVLGPILFLLHISDIDRGVSSGTSTSSYVDDTRVKRPIKNSEIDCNALQADLTAVYDWAKDVNMEFNSDKFEVLRFWPGEKPEWQYFAPDGKIIEEKSDLRDLGVQISSNLKFSDHIENTIASVTKLIGMVLRSFRRRSHRLL